MAITSVSELKNKAVIELTLPGYTVGDDITVGVRRPSIMDLAATGKIPNPLMAAASKLFKDGALDTITTKLKDDGKDMKEFAEVLHCVAKAALVQPTYDQLEEAGIPLTDVQLMMIYDFVLDGVDRYSTFRTIQGNNQDNQHEPDAQPATE